MYRPFKTLLTLSAFALCTVLSAQTTRPNVLIFFIDDLGWTDIGVNDSTFHETPHIVALPASGVNFKRSYSANPVCSPGLTRTCMATDTNHRMRS